jgi:hypothetical protein
MWNGTEKRIVCKPREGVQLMLNVYTPQTVNITHPMVQKAYLKKDLTSNENKEDVLVLETYESEQDDQNFSSFDSYLVDLLTDLQSLKDQAEHKAGKHIGRVDIQRH